MLKTDFCCVKLWERLIKRVTSPTGRRFTKPSRMQRVTAPNKGKASIKRRSKAGTREGYIRSKVRVCIIIQIGDNMTEQEITDKIITALKLDQVEVVGLIDQLITCVREGAWEEAVTYIKTGTIEPNHDGGWDFWSSKEDAQLEFGTFTEAIQAAKEEE